MFDSLQFLSDQVVFAPPVNADSVDCFAFIAVPFCDSVVRDLRSEPPDCQPYASEEGRAMFERLASLSLEPPVNCPAGAVSKGTSNFSFSLGACFSFVLLAALSIPSHESRGGESNRFRD